MGYTSAFKIKDTSGIKIPIQIVNLLDIGSNIEKRSKRLTYIKNIDESKLTVKEYKALQEEKEHILIDPFVFDISPNFQITPNENYFYNFYKTDVILLFINSKFNKIYFQLDNGDVFSFNLDGHYFVGDSELYSASNNAWVEKNIIKLILEFKSSAIIEDMGDDEYGFVYKDGCSRDIKSSKIYKEGELV